MKEKSEVNKYKFTQKYNTETFQEEIEVIIPQEAFSSFFTQALELVSKSVTLSGFRKGKAPQNVVLANRYNEIADRAVELSIEDALKSIGEINPKPLDRLSIKAVEKVDEKKDDSDMKVTVTYLPYPTITLGDFSKVKVKKEEPKKAEKEQVETEVKNIWLAYAKKLDDKLTLEDYKKELVTEEFFEKSGIKAENPNIKSFEDLWKFVEDYMNHTNEHEAEHAYNTQIISELIKKTNYEKAEGIIETELQKRVEAYMNKFKEIGLNPEEYLEKNNVNITELRNEWKTQVDHDVKMELMLQEYGSQNKIVPTEDELKAEMEKLDANTRKMYNFDEDKLKSLVTYYYVNNKAYLELVEKVKTNK
jgi:FKBP-type peptidyl-prolyl cis-trans isomerase (trigger factor)